MKLLLRSSLFALLAVGAYAGVTNQSTKFGVPGAQRPVPGSNGPCCTTPAPTAPSGN